MGRGLLALAVLMALALITVSGAALAAPKQFCPNDSGGLCYGTKRADTMNGRPNDTDFMYALAGADVMHGYNANDYLQGDAGEDTLYGGAGDDELWGGGGPRAYPDRHDDTVYGGPGDDYIYGGAARGGVDTVFGGRGNDTIAAQQDFDYPPTREIVDCGVGTDTVIFDKGLDEVAKNCENKKPRFAWRRAR